MGIQNGNDTTRVLVTGEFTQNENGPAAYFHGEFNMSIWGTFSATLTLERSFDGGTTWLVCSLPDGSDNAWTAPVTVVVNEPERGVMYRLTCTNFSSGPVNWRLSQ